MSAEGGFFPEQVTVDIYTGKQDRAFKGILQSFFIGEMQAAPKKYHDPGSQLCKIMRGWYGCCETGKVVGGPGADR